MKRLTDCSQVRKTDSGSRYWDCYLELQRNNVDDLGGAGIRVPVPILLLRMLGLRRDLRLAGETGFMLTEISDGDLG